MLIGGSEVSLAEGRKYHWSIAGMSDFVVFYEGIGHNYP